MTLLEAALAYAVRGWPVFPIWNPKGDWCACGKPDCKSPAKHPIPRNGLKDATTDRALIERWWTKHPDASIGLCTGPVSGLYVLDVDPKDGGVEQLAQLLQQHGALPHTLEAVTGSGGRHIFFKHLPGLPSSSGKNHGFLPAGLDTRGEGGYVVAAPSMHRSGGQYRWIETDAPLADLPSWILERYNAHVQGKKLQAQQRVNVVSRAGPKLAEYEEAVRAYNAANPRDFPRTASPCPLCPSLDGFKAHGRVPGRWACFSSKHEGYAGTKRQGHYLGDALDIDAAHQGRTRKQHLELTGYWGAGVRAERFYETRDERLAAVEAASDPGAVTVHAPPSAALERNFASLCEILEHPDLVSKVITKPIEWNLMSGWVEIGRERVEDHHVFKLRRLIQLAHCNRKGEGLAFHDQDIWKALELVGRTRTYHPVREYLSGLRWDGTPRIEHMAEDFFGAPNTEVNQVLMTRWMVSCVSRVMPPKDPKRPVNKVDTALILVGPQGYLKDSFLERLAGSQFFASTKMNIGDKDAYEQMRGKWIYDWPELGAMRSARDIDDVKAFLSSQVDRYRKAYGRGTEDVIRSCVFAGSTNRKEFLNDPTGERRFWPIRVYQEIDLGQVDEMRDQLWAEAAELYADGEQWHLTPDERELLASVHEEHREADIWEDTIAQWLEKADATFEPLTTARILSAALEKHKSIHTQTDKQRVGRVMTGLGYALRWVGGRKNRVYAWIHSSVADVA